MTKIIIALTTGMFLATGASAFAKSTALDFQGAPHAASERSVGIDYTPTAAIGSVSINEENSAQNGFGDYSPAPQVLGN